MTVPDGDSWGLTMTVRKGLSWAWWITNSGKQLLNSGRLTDKNILQNKYVREEKNSICVDLKSNTIFGLFRNWKSIFSRIIFCEGAPWVFSRYSLQKINERNLLNENMISNLDREFASFCLIPTIRRLSESWDSGCWVWPVGVVTLSNCSVWKLRGKLRLYKRCKC